MTLITGAEMKKSEKLLKGNNVAPPYEDTAPPDVSDQDTEDRALGRPQPGVEIPDGGYGWICVAAGLTINSFTWGPISVCLVAAIPVKRAFADSRQSRRTASILLST